jgi:EAL domain-containing protein (putative c-di-GMP-specific phosphodiesterase class I)/PAS domain-containing protein
VRMTLSAVPRNAQQQDAASAGVAVLLLDTPENLGVDFLQLLQRHDLKLVFERVHDKEDLYTALGTGNWDILLVCDQVNVPGQDETLAYLKQVGCDTGYILLSKAGLSIDALTRAYRKGIAAVVSAHNPEYSLEVFAREAERCRRNLQLSLLHQEKFDLKRHCMQLMSGTQEALAYLHDGIHVFGNEAYLKLLGYNAMDDLLIVPFIDLVSTEMREKTKQRLLDYQHRARLQPDTKELEIPELFVNAIGAREGILQVAATFKPVVYEGERCVQVVFNCAGSEAKAEEAGAAEGLGYPLFIAHLDNLVAQARVAGTMLGRVLHIRGVGCEHYIARKGFGGLNGKLKALASELRAALGKDDLSIRFTETSFLVMYRTREPDPGTTLTALLAKFETALNRELGSSQDRLVTFAVDAMPVDAQSLPAEQIARNFLQPAARVVDANQRPAPVVKPPEPARQTEAPVLAQTTIDLQRLGAALAANELKLMYETVITVADIETDFHDIGVYLPCAQGGSELVSRTALGSAAAAGTLAAKLDLWTLHHTLAVIGDLYSQGQEHPVLIALSAHALTHRRLAETVRAELQAFGLPPGMLVVDFSIHDLNADLAAGVAQLEKLKGEGISLCISEVRDISELAQMPKHVRVERIRLHTACVEAATRDERAFKALRQSVEELHALKVKVFVGDVAGSAELSMCCKAGIDLVKGKCIQKGPRELAAEAMAEALMT